MEKGRVDIMVIGLWLQQIMSNNHELQEVLSGYQQQNNGVTGQLKPHESVVSQSVNDMVLQIEPAGYYINQPRTQKIARDILLDQEMVQQQSQKQPTLIRNKQKKRLLSTKQNQADRVAQNQRIIKIYDLNEQTNNQTVIKSNLQRQQTLQLRDKLFLNQEIEQKHKTKQKAAQSLLFPIQKKQQISLTPFQQNAIAQVSSSQLVNEAQNLRSNNKRYISQKLQTVNSKLGKGLFYNREDQKQEYKIGYANSKSSLDSGLQVITQLSSRDQLSTRNILLEANSRQRLSNKKLPPLKPYSQIASQTKQIVKIPLRRQPSKPDRSQDVFSNFKYGKFSIKSEQIVDVQNFVRKPIAAGKMIECTLKRNRSCCGACFIQYDLLTTDQKFLISTKKMAFKFNSRYNISLMSGFYKETEEYYVGLVEGNFTGSLFNIFTQSFGTHQKELVATVYYRAKCFCADNKFREIQIYLKNQSCPYSQLLGIHKENNLKDLFQIPENNSQSKIRKFINKPPKWNHQTEVYSQDFRGKLRMASVKNMIIIDEANPSEYLMLLAKQSANEFALDICYPFSPFVGLGILATSFDFKLATQ